MSFVDRRIETRPSSGEAPFKLNEVFFSRTDKRGVIQAGNYIFKRVAHYEWSELIGAPHKLIRHPDMPRGLFHMFWETIQSGKTICAYVKNQAKDGLYYWVFAVVVPYEGGYLSARIKPSSPLLGEAREVYKTMLLAEQQEGLAPEESAEIMMEWVRSQGFEDYDQFAAHALCEEFKSRDKALGNHADETLLSLAKMLENAQTLVDQTEGLVKDFDAMHTIPHNLRVIASRIEPAGGPVTVLSQNYGAMSRQMSDWFAAHVMGENSTFATIKSTVNTSLMVQCITRMLLECDDQLTKERRAIEGVDMAHERATLKQIVTDQLERKRKGQEDVNQEADRIMHACQVMHRQFLGLSSTRVLCKIESARLPESGETLSDIIDQLGVFQRRISERLEQIEKLSGDIRIHDR
ncbi:chemotaxis protein [Phaeobacter sp. QD34_3]|uniref:PAS domain-containing protein n=1 Tax=unclassified Phaeobacter TaxID=2621772 RepID=UPI00237F7104|nr:MULTISPECIES: PAS domain-containing protein [unclassified Phaeobacter]MDE4133725.1 chemotaxis protein [Phaeobacter sp. QD34_3]MDE4137342.1 chemotaxis protein [Phaeobacter sp. QD34_24]MDE4176480.1 chemotaxis protein [Phaeobacter sp. PT47_59]